MLLNGICALIVTTFGLVQFVLSWMPMESVLPILIFVGIAMTTEAFITSDSKDTAQHVGEQSPEFQGEQKPRDPDGTPLMHLIGVAVGILPSLSNLSVTAVTTTLQIVDLPLQTYYDKFAPQYYLGGAIALSQGFLLSSILLSAVTIFWIDRLFLKAAVCLIILCILSWIGIIHAFQITDNGIENLFVGQNGNWIVAKEFVISYGIFALFMILLYILQQKWGFWSQGNLVLHEGVWTWHETDHEKGVEITQSEEAESLYLLK